jgi:hypothetical protein
LGRRVGFIRLKSLLAVRDLICIRSVLTFEQKTAARLLGGPGKEYEILLYESGQLRPSPFLDLRARYAQQVGWDLHQGNAFG